MFSPNRQLGRFSLYVVTSVYVLSTPSAIGTERIKKLKLRTLFTKSALGPLWSSSCNVNLCISLYVPFPCNFFRPLIGPQITWSVQGPSLANPPQTATPCMPVLHNSSTAPFYLPGLHHNSTAQLSLPDLNQSMMSPLCLNNITVWQPQYSSLH